MASKKVFVIMGFFFMVMNIVVQSAPIGKGKQSFQSSSNDSKKSVNEPHRDSSSSEEKPALTTIKATTTISSTTNSTNILAQHSSINNIQEKKKRSTFIDQLNVPTNNENAYLTNDDFVDDDDEHVLHANIKEMSAQIHDNADKPVDTDDSRIYSDIQMTPFNWKTIRRRRQIQLNEQSAQRRKRALSPYQFFDTDSYYDPYEDLMEQEEYDRPMRSFAPLYWYPNVYQRAVRSDDFVPSYYESSELPRLYSHVIEQEQDDIDDDDGDDDNYGNNNDDESNESPVLLFDDENDYESNHYPILVPSSNLALNNYDLQQQYNLDDLPIDENEQIDLNDNDDDDEEYGLYNINDSPYFTRYEPTDAYFSLRD